MSARDRQGSETGRRESRGLRALLARGHGAGFLEALAAPPEHVRPLLIECITEDPRHDRQQERRADYYAALGQAVDLDPAPLGPRLRELDSEDDRVPLIVDTLGRLTLRGCSSSRALLDEQLQEGEFWPEAIDALADAGLAEGLDALVCDRFDSPSALKEAIEFATGGDAECEPWAGWGTHNERVAAAMARLDLDPETLPPANLGAVSVDDLFDHAGEAPDKVHRLKRAIGGKVEVADLRLLFEKVLGGQPIEVELALVGLGALGTAEAFAGVQAFVETALDPDPLLVAAAARAAAMMPGEICLEVGRAWFLSSAWRQVRIGLEILKQHATADDLMLLRTALNTSLVRDHTYLLCGVLSACGRLEGVGAVWELEQAYREVTFSRARVLAARAVAITDPVGFTTGSTIGWVPGLTASIECLWDCEPETRIIGCETADLESSLALDRLQDLASDPLEAAEVRAAARARQAERPIRSGLRPGSPRE